MRLSECRDSSRPRSDGNRPKIAGEMTFQGPVKHLFILKIDIDIVRVLKYGSGIEPVGVLD